SSGAAAGEGMWGRGPSAPDPDRVREGALGRQPLAALGAAAVQDLAAVLGRHAQAEAMTALTHEAARLVGALHGTKLRSEKASGPQPRLGCGERRCIGEERPGVNCGGAVGGPGRRPRELGRTAPLTLSKSINR